jgi:hypothetical protein
VAQAYIKSGDPKGGDDYLSGVSDKNNKNALILAIQEFFGNKKQQTAQNTTSPTSSEQQNPPENEQKKSSAPLGLDPLGQPLEPNPYYTPSPASSNSASTSLSGLPAWLVLPTPGKGKF